MSVDTKTAIVLDKSLESKLQINFNVTLHALACRYASLDIADVMGTHLQNVTSNIIKTRIDRDGRVLGRAAKDAKKLVYAEPRGAPEHVPQVSPELSQKDFMSAVTAKKLVMVNFYAPWCPWSRRLTPVWEEAFHEIMKTPEGNDVSFGKVDCTGQEGQDLCQAQHVHAFPTIKIYRRHNPHSREQYVGDRTHEALEKFVLENVHDADASEALREGDSEMGGDGEGCTMRGVVFVNRVPGNFHISAHSRSHSFQPGRLNMSHTVGYMSFGRMLSPAQTRLLPKEGANGFSVLANSAHLALVQNTTLEHYLKVVHTTYQLSRGKLLDTYQYTVNNNNYQDGASLPSAVFSYDLSPMQVVVTEEREAFASFLTQICAIIGGVFTVTGLLDSVVYHAISGAKKLS